MQILSTTYKVTEHVKHFDLSFGSQVLQLDAKVHGVHFERFVISAVSPTAQGQVLFASGIFVPSHDKQILMFSGSQVLQFEITSHNLQFDKLLRS